MKKFLMLLLGFLLSMTPPLWAVEKVEEVEEEEPSRKTPIDGMVAGVNEGTRRILDHTVKGAYRIATLGQSELESYQVEEPEKGSGDVTKIKISIPGT